MKHLFILLTAMSISIVSQAQTAGKVSGSIKDGGNQKVIDAATISLLKAQDSSLVKAALTDKDGNFVFENVKEGTYLVAASSMGHKKVYSNPFAISQAAPEMQIGVLQLVPDKVDLKEVVVNAKKPFIERKSDRTVINVDAAISNAGTTALEVLEKSPGVTVDKDGNISLKGKQGVLVMMDGKQTYLTAQDLANLLKTMPSSSIDQIELMTNPSAKYDAAGNSGIINIKTKKNKQKGFNGNISSTYTQGVYASTNNSANVNYRNGKINAFATVSGNVRTRFENIDITRHYYNTDKSLKAIFEQNNFIKSTNENYNAKLGLDFYANKKATIGFVVTGFTTPQTKSILNTSYLKSNTGNLDSIVQAKNTEDNSWKNGSVNLNFRKQIDSTGRELTADVDYATFRAMNNMNLSNTSYTPTYDFKGREILIGELPKDINIYSAKVDYTHPFKSGLKLETGIKSSYVNTDNTAGYFNLNGNEKTPDYEKTNHFKYKENINAAYINASREFKKWSFQAGLRLENTYYKGHQLGNPERQDSSFERNFTNLFPTVFVGYNANEKNQFNISYGRRIDRPDYEDLNPFFFFLDKYTYEAGNPFLLPMYSNTFEIAHTYNQFLTTTFTYTNTKDFITQAFEQSGYASIIRQTNYGKKNSYNLSVSAQVTITKWWTASIYGEGNYSNYKGILFGEQVNIAGSNALINVSNQFKFKKGWSAELSGFYRTQGIEGQVIVNPLGQMSAGVQKNILNNKATIKLNVRDIFKTLPASGKIEFQNTKATFDQNRDSRVVSLSFSYRFGKPIKSQQKRKTGGASEEQNRIKSVN